MNSIYKGLLKPRNIIAIGFLSLFLAACTNQPNSFFTGTHESITPSAARTTLPAMTFETTQALNQTPTPRYGGFVNGDPTRPCTPQDTSGAGSDFGSACLVQAPTELSD